MTDASTCRASLIEDSYPLDQRHTDHATSWPTSDGQCLADLDAGPRIVDVHSASRLPAGVLAALLQELATGSNSRLALARGPCGHFPVKTGFATVSLDAAPPLNWPFKWAMRDLNTRSLPCQSSPSCFRLSVKRPHVPSDLHVYLCRPCSTSLHLVAPGEARSARRAHAPRLMQFSRRSGRWPLTRRLRGWCVIDVSPSTHGCSVFFCSVTVNGNAD